MKTRRIFSFFMGTVVAASMMPSFGVMAEDTISVYKRSYTEVKVKEDFDKSSATGLDAVDVTVFEAVNNGENGLSAIFDKKSCWLGKNLTATKNRTEFDIYADDFTDTSFQLKLRISGTNQPQIAYLDAGTAINGKFRVRNMDDNTLAGMIWMETKMWNHIVVDTDFDARTYTFSVYNGSKGTLNGSVTARMSADAAIGNNLRIVSNFGASPKLLAVDNFKMKAVTETAIAENTVINMAELADTDAILVQAPDSTLYDNGLLFETSDKKLFDITNLPFGEHKLTSANASFNISFTEAGYRTSKNYNFNNYEDGIPQGFSGVESLGFIDGGIVSSFYGKSVLMGIDDTYEERKTAGATNNTYIDQLLGADKCRVEFDFNSTSTLDTFDIYLRQSSTLQPCILNMDVSSAGRLRVRNAANSIAGTLWPAPDTWYHLVIDIDGPNNVFSATLYNEDGSVKSATVNSTLPAGITGDAFFRIRTSSRNNISRTAIDNFKISKPVDVPQVTFIGNDDNEVCVADEYFEFGLDGALDISTFSATKLSLKSKTEIVYIKSAELSNDGNLISVVPEKTLRYNDTYQLFIDKSVRCANGMAIGRPLVETFNTVAADGINIDLGGIKNASGVVIAQVVAGDTVSVAADVLNNSESDEEKVALIMALYNADNSLSVVDLDEAGLTANEEKKLSTTISIPESFEDGEIKIYIWNGIENMVPIIEPVTVEKKAVATPMSIYLVGDSIGANYSDDYYPQEGYGEFVQKYFQDGVTVHNHCMPGRSTKTFITEGRWQAILDVLERGDYVFVCMGHNDQPGSDRSTTIEEYKDNLKRYANETREKGAEIIFFSPISKGGMVENYMIERSLAMEQAAADAGVVYLDVNGRTYKEMTDMGIEKARDTYYLSDAYIDALVAAGEMTRENHPNAAISSSEDGQDVIHVNVVGADYIAKTVADLLRESVSPLKELLK